MNTPGLPQIMGIVNTTPDSFSDGGQFTSPQQAIDHALRFEDEGAAILDIGGESTRPGSDTVPEEEELRRVIPVIEGLAKRTHTQLSIDTRKPRIMRKAIEAGAHIINDVSALTYDAESLKTASELACPVILMHAQGDPKTMQNDPSYNDVVTDVLNFLKQRISACENAGIPKSRLIVDPGIGFGKTLQHNLTLLANLDQLQNLGVPLLIGASRKSFIGTLTGEQDPKNRLAGSLAAALFSAYKGAQIIRVHDVAETARALTVWQAIQEHRENIGK